MWPATRKKNPNIFNTSMFMVEIAYTYNRAWASRAPAANPSEQGVWILVDVGRLQVGDCVVMTCLDSVAQLCERRPSREMCSVGVVERRWAPAVQAAKGAARSRLKLPFGDNLNRQFVSGGGEA